MYYFLFVIIILVQLFILNNITFTAWPEMFSYPYLINNGFKLYQDIALPYEPILSESLAVLYKMFGYNLIVLKLFTWGIIILADILILLISRKIIRDGYKSLIPVVFFAIMQPFFEGNMLWFDLSVTPFLLLAVFSIYYLENFRKYLLFGLFLGIAFFIKQQVGLAIALVLGYFLITKQWKEIFHTGLGLLIPTIMIAVYILFKDIVNDYFFWTVVVPLYWYPKFPGYVNLPSTKEFLGLLLLALPLLSVLAVKKTYTKNFLIILFLFLGSFITAFPRFELFRLQPALAMYILLLAFVVLQTKKYLIFWLIPVILVVIVLGKNILFKDVQNRFYSEADIKTASQIKMLQQDNQLFLIGLSSLNYVLTDSIPPKPWIDNYVWYLEIPGMQQKVIDGFEESKTNLILRRSPELGNWYDLGVYQPQQIVDYMQMNYDKQSFSTNKQSFSTNKQGSLNGDIEIWKRKD